MPYLCTFLFGQLPSPTPLIPFSTVFGYRDDYSLPLTVFPFDREEIDWDTFANHLETPETNAVTLRTAWRVYRALVGLPDELLPHGYPTWRPDWRKQLPPVS